MDGQPLLLLFSVHVVYQFPPLAGAENRLLSPAPADGGISSLPHMAGFGNGRGSMPLLRGSTPCHATKDFECRKADLPMEEKSEARRAVSSPQHSRTEVT